MNIEISDDLWKRIEYFAALYKKTPTEYFQNILEQQVPRIPNKEAAVQHLQDLIDGKYADPELDEDDLDEYLRGLAESRLRFSSAQVSETGGAKS